MAKPTVVMNIAGVRALLRSPEVQRELRRRAEKVAAAAGPGNDVETSMHPRRSRVAVVTTTPAARRRQARDKSLTKALQAGRG